VRAVCSQSHHRGIAGLASARRLEADVAKLPELRNS
jgi:hypothetical protein